MTTAPNAGPPADDDAYRLLFDANPQPMWVFDVQTLAFLAVNDAAVATYGWSREEFLRMTIRDIRPAEDVSALEADIKAERAPLRGRGTWRHKKRDGTVFDVAISAHDLAFEERLARLVVAVDVTEQREAEEALRRNEERFRLLAENAQDLVFRYRVLPEPGFEYVSPASERILGYTTDELYADPSLVLQIVDTSHLQEMDDLPHDPRFSEPRDVRVRRRDGNYSWIEQRMTPVFDDEGHLAAVEGIARDISERKRVEATIAHQALHDALTELPNRLLLLDRLSQALARTARDENFVAVLLLDLDRFKLVN